jgi:hypothetical protein
MEVSPLTASPRSQSCTIKKVEAHDFVETGRGNAAMETVKRGDVILEIPIERCFSLESAKRSEILTKAIEEYRTRSTGNGVYDGEVDMVTHDQYLAVHVLVEENMGEKSEHEEHIRALPKTFDLPIFWNEEEKRALIGTTCLVETIALEDEIAQDYESLQKKLGVKFLEEQNITYDRFKWARAVLLSRQCDLLRPAPETTRLRLLVPDFDMFNHSSKVALGSSHRLNYEKGLVTAFATSDYEKGEQCFISYGSGEASSSKLLLWYGFSPLNEENPYEELDLTLTSFCSAERAELLKQALFLSAQIYLRKIDNEWIQEKETLLKNNNVNLKENLKYLGEPYLPMVVNILHAPNEGKNGEFIVRHSLPEISPFSFSLLAYARVQFLTEEDCRNPEIVATMLNACSNLPSSDEECTILDHANEIGALATTVSLLQNVKSNQPWEETHEESERKAQDTSSNSNFRYRCAARVRGVERRIAENAMRDSHRRLHLAMRTCLRSTFSIREGLCGNCDVCKASGCPWVHHLASKDTEVTNNAHKSARVAISGIEEHLPLRGHLQIINLCFLWMTGHVQTSSSSLSSSKSSQLLARAMSHFETWPMHDNDAFNERTKIACDYFDELANRGLDGANGEPHPHRGEAGEMLLPGAYNRIVRQWSTRMFSQIATSRVFSLSEANTIAMESAALRKRHAFSIPTSAALEEIKKYSPILEMCCGSGLWARRLHEIGCDITAYTTSFETDVRNVQWYDGVLTCENEKAVVRAETLARNKTLLLSWPDKSGEGSRGLDIIKSYEGETLILVGEWNKRTYGSYVSFLPESGASFSKSFQDYVEANFILTTEIAIGNWPMYDSTLMIYRRREPLRPKTP